MSKRIVLKLLKKNKIISDRILESVLLTGTVADLWNININLWVSPLERLDHIVITIV